MAELQQRYIGVAAARRQREGGAGEGPGAMLRRAERSPAEVGAGPFPANLEQHLQRLKQPGSNRLIAFGKTCNGPCMAVTSKALHRPVAGCGSRSGRSSAQVMLDQFITCQNFRQPAAALSVLLTIIFFLTVDKATAEV